MGPQGAGVQAGSGLVSKTTPLLGARGYVLCPGSWHSLGELDGGVWAQIPGERREIRGDLSSEDVLIPLQAGSGYGGMRPWEDVADMGPGVGRGQVELGTPGREGATHSPFMEPLLRVGEVGAGAISTDIFWPGFTQVFGGLVGAVQMVMLQVVLGSLLHWPPRFDFPAIWGLHRQQGAVAILPGPWTLIVEQEASGGH